ncbi:Bacterial regulatory proteins, tetR family [Mycobacterium basiliense]|uniref:Bacterial regulatory proteins, tetR family n=1 Tax=Mycobacterium basiliense TaxID=2094119 RepID=A0A447G9V8_9MYCO|nr:TetR/AcrR family transcriptional regulator [Mycobacterium basiliense]VDM87259.1 Bacterial regulatory proteins, tetR family [Mycobacterium basiliense]
MQVASPEVAIVQSVRHQDRILEIVVHILETEGYDAVQLREVARRARTSLATIYKHYANRDELILAALEFWMDEHHYAGLADQTHPASESLYAGMMRVLRTIFQPWEAHPDILKAYFRARVAPGGQRLVRRGLDMVVPAAMEVLADVDAGFINDLDTVISSLVYGLLGRFTAGEIAITEILPSIDRTMFWLMNGYEAGRPS